MLQYTLLYLHICMRTHMQQIASFLGVAARLQRHMEVGAAMRGCRTVVQNGTSIHQLHGSDAAI